jgi:hypothetical protein
MTKSIPLRNKKKEIIGYCMVSDVDFDRINAAKWHLNKHGYVAGYFERKMQLMHRVILNAKKGQLVDHKDRNKINNTRDNIRITTASANSHNKAKLTTARSKYIGVSYVKATKQHWKADFQSNTIGKYCTEQEAAWAYDEHVKGIYGDLANINGISKPENFIPYIKPVVVKRKDALGNDLPTNISYIAANNTYNVAFQGTFSCYCSSLEEALKIKLNCLEKIVALKDATKSLPIQRNLDGVAIIALKKYKGIQYFALVDDEDWTELNAMKWFYRNGYVGGCKKIKLLTMHRYLKKANDPEIVVDHINKNKLDNRKCNLRFATQAQNAANRSKAANRTSKYLGVSWATSHNGWAAKVSAEGKTRLCGHYESEEVAAWVRDMNAIELQGEFAVLNKVPAPEGYVMHKNKGYLKTDLEILLSKPTFDILNVFESAGFFQVNIMNDKKAYAFGKYKDLNVAKWVRDQAAIQLFGESAKLLGAEQPKGWIYKDNRGVFIESKKRTRDSCDEDEECQNE